MDTFTPPAPLQTAVLFLIFNRPDTTVQVFEAIRRAKPPRLYVAADGPRADRAGEADKVAKVREIATAVDWPCEVQTLFREENLGCKYAVSGGITWFFEHESQGIILEDDCLPHSSFFGFCEQMLCEYRDQKSVMHIGGYKPRAIGRDAFSISFTRATHIWGWATWADRWEKYKPDLTVDKARLDLLTNYEYFCSRASTVQRQKLLKRVVCGELDTWDYQWNFSVRANGGVGIRPAVNLVRNLGFNREDATHTRGKQIQDPVDGIDLCSLELPPWILINRELEIQFDRLNTSFFSLKLLWGVLRNLFR